MPRPRLQSHFTGSAAVISCAAGLTVIAYTGVTRADFTSNILGYGSVPVGVLDAPTAVTGTPAGTVANPSLPISLRSANAGFTSAPGPAVRVTWTAVTFPGTGTSGYYVERYTSEGATPAPGCGSSPAALLPASATSCTDTGLEPGTSYRYRVVAVYDSWGSSSLLSGLVTLARQRLAKMVVEPSTLAPIAGAPFDVTLTAIDEFGETDTGFTGPQCLTFSGPDNAADGATPTYPPPGDCTEGSAVVFDDGLATVSLTLVDPETIALEAADTRSGVSGVSGLLSIGEPTGLTATVTASSTTTSTSDPQKITPSASTSSVPSPTGTSAVVTTSSPTTSPSPPTTATIMAATTTAVPATTAVTAVTKTATTAASTMSSPGTSIGSVTTAVSTTTSSTTAVTSDRQETTPSATASSAPSPTATTSAESTTTTSADSAISTSPTSTSPATRPAGTTTTAATATTSGVTVPTGVTSTTMVTTTTNGASTTVTTSTSVGPVTTAVTTTTSSPTMTTTTSSVPATGAPLPPSTSPFSDTAPSWFSLGPSSPTPTTASPFEITITALSSIDSVDTAYTGAQCLEFTNVQEAQNGAAPVFPPQGNCLSGSSVLFDDGLAVVNVALFDAGTTALKVTDDTSGAYGETGPISVEAPTEPYTTTTVAGTTTTTLLTSASTAVTTNTGVSTATSAPPATTVTTTLAAATRVAPLAAAEQATAETTTTSQVPTTLPLETTLPDGGTTTQVSTPSSVPTVSGGPQDTPPLPGFFSVVSATPVPRPTVPFEVTITALDNVATVDTAFDGPQCVTFSGPDNATADPAIYPAQGECATGSNVVFAKGLATVSVTLARPETTILQVTDNASGVSGVSEPIYVGGQSLVATSDALGTIASRLARNL